MPAMGTHGAYPFCCNTPLTYRSSTQHAGIKLSRTSADTANSSYFHISSKKEIIFPLASIPISNSTLFRLDAISLINSNIKEKISENKTLIPDTIKINYIVKDVNLDKGTARISCEVSEDLASKIHVEELRRTLAGTNEVEVRQYFTSRSEIESAKVIFWPFWVKKIPEKENKIKITID